MASPNLNMRDPVLYRILHMEHHRTGNEWCIYPMYDYAHGQSDSLEKITHSMCSLEFADHQPLYNWFIEQLGIFPSQQIEFDRLSLTYTVMSKRLLRRMVEDGTVRGWDDPRMPTLGGLRRRGYTPEAIRNFVAAVGVSRTNGIVDLAMLEHFLREDLNKHASRVMAVLRPLKVVIDNYPEARSKRWMRPIIRKTRALVRAKFPSRASSTLSKTTSAKCLHRNISALHLDARCACVTDTSSPARAL
jgi:glutaminyl-tRNA synthetase